MKLIINYNCNRTTWLFFGIVTSLAVGLTGPVLVPVSSLAYHVVSALLIDPETVCLSLGLIPGIFWNIGVLGNNH